MGSSRYNSTFKSCDSGYGDDASDAARDGPDSHPLSLKGYDIGPASRLQVGDVFEFLWADAPEYGWEWKCLGYTRFIVLRHSETFPHHCACIPISTGSKSDFAKPGIDSFQQGYVFAAGEPTPGHEQPKGGPRLQYSAVGIELRPGKIRVKEDSRANYADIVEVDHDAQVMVVGDVVRYFDRVRRNVNKAFMRQVLRKALEQYKAGKTAREPSAGQSVNVNNDKSEIQAEAQVRDQREDPEKGTHIVKDEEAKEAAVIISSAEAVVPDVNQPDKDDNNNNEEDALAGAECNYRPETTESLLGVGTRDGSKPVVDEKKRKPGKPGESGERQWKTQNLRLKELREGGALTDYDLRSMHNVAMAGLK